MLIWDLAALDVQPRHPEVLSSNAEGRAIAIQLPTGVSLSEHQVHERGWLIVVGGRVEISEPDGTAAEGGPGLLAQFDPNERREITATADARLLLLLSPWPGEGHPSQRG